MNNIDCVSATCARDACHHFSRFLDENIAGFRRALEAQSAFSKTKKRDLKGFVRRDACWAADRVLKLCKDPDRSDRLGRGMASIDQIAGDAPPMELSTIGQQILQVREKLAAVRQNFYPPACYVEQRIMTDLSVIVGPLCDEIERLVVQYYTVVKARYALPELNARGMQ